MFEAQGRARVAKEELLEFEGIVTDVLPDARFRVKLDNDTFKFDGLFFC